MTKDPAITIWSQGDKSKVLWEGPCNDLPGINLAARELYRADMDGLDLSGANFTRANLKFSRLQNAILVGARFTAAALMRADFSMADLSYVDFRGADISRCKFNGAKLDYADFRGANMTGCDFTEASFTGVVLDGNPPENVKWPEGFNPVHFFTYGAAKRNGDTNGPAMATKKPRAEAKER